MEDTPLQKTTRILRSALGRTPGIDILAEYDYSTEMRIHGKDFVLTVDAWGQHTLHYRSEWRELGYAQEAMEGLRHIAWALGR